MQTYLDGAQLIRNIAQETFGDIFKEYFLGAPDDIPESALPCVVIQKVSGTFSSSATSTDDRTEEIVIVLNVNGKDGFGNPSSEDTVMRQLSNYIEEIDPATGSFKPTTLMGMLRRNLSLNGNVIDSSAEINYDVNMTPDQDTIYQAFVTVTLLRRVYITDRS
ncbi:MAG: hypothetical protein KGZ81_07425 [Flavobacteriales bacterium]|nr:hypothetical protein [Flavobacteriales bacterium]